MLNICFVLDYRMSSLSKLKNMAEMLNGSDIQTLRNNMSSLVTGINELVKLEKENNKLLTQILEELKNAKKEK